MLTRKYGSAQIFTGRKDICTEVLWMFYPTGVSWIILKPKPPASYLLLRRCLAPPLTESLFLLASRDSSSLWDGVLAPKLQSRAELKVHPALLWDSVGGGLFKAAGNKLGPVGIMSWDNVWKLHDSSRTSLSWAWCSSLAHDGRLIEQKSCKVPMQCRGKVPTWVLQDFQHCCVHTPKEPRSFLLIKVVQSRLWPSLIKGTFGYLLTKGLSSKWPTGRDKYSFLSGHSQCYCIGQSNLQAFQSFVDTLMAFGFSEGRCQCAFWGSSLPTQCQRLTDIIGSRLSVNY